MKESTDADTLASAATSTSAAVDQVLAVREEQLDKERDSSLSIEKDDQLDLALATIVEDIAAGWLSRIA